MTNIELQNELAKLPPDATVGLFRYTGQFMSHLVLQPVTAVILSDHDVPGFTVIGLELGKSLEVVK